MHILSVKFRQGKVTKFWLNGKYFYPMNIFTRRILLSKNLNFRGNVTKFTYFFPMNALFNALILRQALFQYSINSDWLLQILSLKVAFHSQRGVKQSIYYRKNFEALHGPFFRIFFFFRKILIPFTCFFWNPFFVF